MYMKKEELEEGLFRLECRKISLRGCEERFKRGCDVSPDQPILSHKSRFREGATEKS
jgi:hypothetical protein